MQKIWKSIILTVGHLAVDIYAQNPGKKGALPIAPTYNKRPPAAATDVIICLVRMEKIALLKLFFVNKAT
jgi:hypothetical protein